MTDSRRGFFLAIPSLALATISCFASSGVAHADHLAFVEVQKSGMAGVTALSSPFSGAIAPDGSSLYVAAANSGSVVAFAIEPATGHLSFLGSYPTPAVTPRRVSVSGDGKDVY